MSSDKDPDVTMMPRHTGESDEEYLERIKSFRARIEKAEEQIRARRGDTEARIAVLEDRIATQRDDLRDVRDEARASVREMREEFRRLTEDVTALHTTHMPELRREIVSDIRDMLEDTRQPGMLSTIRAGISTIGGSKVLSIGAAAIMVAVAVSLIAGTGYSIITDYFHLTPGTSMVFPDKRRAPATPMPEPTTD